MRLAVALLLCCCQVAAAQADDRAALIADFGEAMGIEQMIAGLKEEAEKGVAAQGDAVVANLAKEGYSDEALAEVRNVYGELMKQVLDSWTAEEASRIYIEAIAESMSNDDLAAVVAFYESEEGQKSTSAIATGASRMQAYIQASVATSMRTAMAEFGGKMKVIVAADIEKRKKGKAADTRE